VSDEGERGGRGRHVVLMYGDGVESLNLIETSIEVCSDRLDEMMRIRSIGMIESTTRSPGA